MSNSGNGGAGRYNGGVEVWAVVALALALGAGLGWFWARRKGADAEAELRGERGRAAEKDDAIGNLRAELIEARGRHSRDAEEIGGLKKTLESERAGNAEKAKFIADTNAAMNANFRNLAQEILEEKKKKFGEESRQILAPLSEQLKDFRKEVSGIHTKDAEQRAELRTELNSHISALKQNAEQLSADAGGLTRALKGESKKRGDWGEVQLELLLKNSGLRPGKEYETQKTLDGESGALRPDVIVHLPEERHLIVDSKVSLNDYAAATAAEENKSREESLALHARAVRRHIDDLSGKHYPAAKGVNAPDFVLLFMPVEPAFFAALEKDGQLFQYAYGKKIILTAPTTLMAVMQTVERIWRMERQTQNANAIAEQGAKLYDKFAGFVADMETMEATLEKTRGAHKNAMDKLRDGRGSLIRQTEKLRELGVAPKKKLPREFIASDNGDDAGD